MKTALRDLFYGTLSLAGATALAKRYNRSRVPILFYHGVCAEPVDGLLNCEKNHVAAEDFERHLRHLSRRYQVIPLSRLAAAARGESAMPERAAAITFDDGFENNYTMAFPLLKKYRLPATMYLPSDFVVEGKGLWVDRLAVAFSAATSFASEGERTAAYLDLKSRLKKSPNAERLAVLEKTIGELTGGREPSLPPLLSPLKRAQVREMAASGLVEFGSHSCSHPMLTSLPLEDARREISASRRILAEFAGAPIDSFSYPNGAFSPEHAKMVEEAGYSSATAVRLRLCDPAVDSVYDLSRVALAEGDGDGTIAATLSGVRQAMIALRGGS